MNEIGTDSIRKAIRIFMKLLEKGRVRKTEDSELYAAYDDPDVSEVMSVLEDEAGVMLLRTSDTIYYTPKTENRLFGFNNEELRKSMNLGNNTELYTVYIIILCIIIKFYNGENYNAKCRTLLKVEELERYITSKLQVFSERENKEEEEERIAFNFSAVSKVWLEMPPYDEKIISYARSSGTRISLIFKTLNFLKDQGLVNVANENEIFTTEKLDIMATAYYPESSRKKELLSYIEGLLEGGVG